MKHNTVIFALDNQSGQTQRNKTMMTKKDFERIAQVMRVNYPVYQDQRMLHKNIVDDMCVELKAINPRFDEQRFRAACEKD
jgi:hypothetical protein